MFVFVTRYTRVYITEKNVRAKERGVTRIEEGNDKRGKLMLATSAGGLYFRDERCENTGRFYVTEKRVGVGDGGHVFLRESLRLRHLAFHRKYLFYGRWHGSLTFVATAVAAASATPPLPGHHMAMLYRKLHAREWKKKFYSLCCAESNIACALSCHLYHE